MTTAEAQNLKYGSKVIYCGALAIVQRVTSVGVVISFDGFGPKRGEYITRRVSARHLEIAT